MTHRLSSSLILLTLAAWVLPTRVSHGAEGPEAAPPSALEFRRVYAPANQWKDWPRDHLRYVPMKPEEFERLVQTAEATGPELSSGVGALVSAQYRAILDTSLDTNVVLRGEAVLAIRLPAKRELLLPLAPCNLAITQARWLEADSPPPELGLAADGTLMVRVKQSGDLRLEWSLRGQPDAGGWQFALAFPRCPASRFLLDLPAKMQPILASGVALRDSTEAGQTHWRIELGGHHQLPLRITTGGDTEPGRRLALVREALAYDLSLHGLDLSAELRLDIHHEPLRELVVTLDPHLKLVKAQCGETAIPWSVLAPAADGQGVRVLLPLPEPLQGTGRILRLGAVAPLELERRWRLPAIHTEGLFWQEGNATIGVRAPLSLKQLLPVGGRQSKTGALSGPRPGESAELQYFSKDAGVDVVLERSRAQLQVESGTSVQLSRGEIRAQVVAELSTLEGEIFQWEANLGRQWLIDSIESQPAEALGEGWEESDGKLSVHLDKAIAPGRPVRLVITSRRLQPALGQPLGLEDLTPLHLTEATSRKRLMAVYAVEPYSLKVTSLERVKQLEPGKLTAAERSLFLESPRNLVFESDAGAAGLQISLVSPKPSYRASIRTEATALTSEATGPHSHWLRESYAVHCVPDAARIDRVLIHFCIARAAPPQWSLGAGAEGPFEARRLSAAEQASALMDTRGETWQLSFRQAKASPFEIRATRLVEWKDETPVSLVCVPEAAQQQGTLVVGSTGGTTIGIDNERLEPMPLEELSPELLNSAQAKFRYAPMNDAIHADQPVVTLQQEKRVLPAVWIWDSHVESRYQAEGTGRHTLRYCLENSGQPRLELVLPASASLKTLAGVWTDGQPAAWQIIGETTARRLAVDLPSDRRFPVVCLQFQTESGPLQTGKSLSPPFPTVDVPILTQRWTVWLPPGYEAHRPGLFRDAGEETSVNGSQHLFGFWGRTTTASPFDPVALDTWRKLLSQESEGAAMRASAARFLAQLGEIEQKSRKAANNATLSKPLNWGSLLSQSLEGLETVLLVDPAALARQRLDARSPVVTARSAASADRGLALLQQADLALLVFAQGFLLTSAQEAASYQSYLTPLNDESVWQVQASPLAEQLRQASVGNDKAIFVPVDQWPERPQGPTDPWIAASAGTTSLDSLGWTVHRVAVSPGTPLELSVVCLDSLRSYQAMIFLAVFALLAWITRTRPAVALIVLGLAVSAAYLLAEPYAMLASGAGLGSVMALLLYLIRRRRPADRPQEHPPAPPSIAEAPTTAPSTAPGIAVLVLTLSSVLGVSPAQAQEVSAAPAAGPRQVHNVLIPVDDQQRPTGENYFVPEGLYQQLQRQATASGAAPQGWLLRSALYRGNLTRQAAPEQFVLSDLKASFDLEVFQPSTRIRLPLGREGANLLPDGARLDGRVLQLEWQEQDTALVFEVREPGPYRLELSLRPAVRTFENSSGIELQIPRLPMSRLELNLPSDAPAIDVPSALGAVQQVPPRLVAELGNSDRLTLRWPDTPGSTRIGPALDVEALYWLKVHPGSVVLSTRLKVKVVEGSVRQLRLTTDPRLRLLPPRDPASPVSQVKTTAGDPQVFQFELARPVSDQVVVEADFLLAGISGIGNVRLPQIQIADARVTKRWLAISVDRALVSEEQATDRLEAVAVPAFEAAWGKTDNAPGLIYSLPSSQPAWSLATHPDAPRITVDQRTVLNFSPGSARVQFDAQLVTTGYSFQYHLTAPKQLQIERVLVRGESTERAARWSRDTEGGITVFLGESASGSQQLTLFGKMNTPIRGSAMLPLLRVDGTEIRSSEVQLFRHPSVLVDLTEVQGLQEADLPFLGEDKDQQGRLVKRFVAVDGSLSASATIKLVPNQPELVADQITWVRTDGKTWDAEAEFSVKVHRGVADEFRIQIPSQWSGPYQVEPAASYRIVTDAGNRRRELVLRPRQAVDRTYSFRVSGPISARPGERVATPSIWLQEADRSKSLLVLPTKAGSQKITWETHGLKGIELPAELAASTTAEASTVYELETPSFQALLNPVDRSHHTANIVLADLHVAWQVDGSYQGLGLFDLEPAGLGACPLHLPAEVRLLSVRVEGVPVTPQPQGPGLWLIPLESTTIPQRIEVLVAGQLPDPTSTGSCRFEVPSLGSLPVWQTLWSILGPADLHARLVYGGDAADALQMDLIRLQGIATITDLIQSLSLNRPDEPEKTASWQAIWRRRWEGRRQQIRQESGDRPPRSSALTTELANLDRRYKELSTRLDHGVGPALPVATTSSLDPQLWPGRERSPQAMVRGVSAPGTSVLVLQIQPTSHCLPSDRLLAIFGGVLLIFVGSVGALRRLVFRLCCRWPATVGVAVGLIWWLWLGPSVLGFLWLLLTLLVWLLPVWQPPRRHTAIPGPQASYP